MRKEYDDMSKVTTRDVSKEFEAVLNESKNSANIDGGKDAVKVGDLLEGDGYSALKPIETSTEESYRYY